MGYDTSHGTDCGMCDTLQGGSWHKLRHIFFLIGKVISLKAKRQRREYTRSIPKYKEVKHQRANKPHPYLVASQSTKSIKEKVFLNIYPNPIHKSVQKNELNILVVPLNIIKGPPIPFFLNGLHQAEGGRSPNFLPFLAHKRTMPTQEVPFHSPIAP